MSTDDQDIKLSYLPAQARIRLVISKAACDRYLAPPEDMIQRAVTRLEQGVSDGSLAFYYLYRERINLVWQRMRAKKFKPDKRIAVTLAAGAPPMPEISITAGPEPFLASLSINASIEKLSQWKFEFLKLTIQKILKDKGIQGHPDSAMLQAIFLRAQRGKRITNMPINAAPKLDSTGAEQFSVMPRGVNGDLVLVINNISSVATMAARASILDWLTKYVESAAARSHKHYHFLKDDVEGRLKSFLRGPERLSIDLPATILAAIAEPKATVHADPAASTSSQVPQRGEHLHAHAARPMTTSQPAAHLECAKYFQIEIDPSKMEASIKIVSDAIFSDNHKFTKETVEAFIRAKSIRFGLREAAIDTLLQSIKDKKEERSFVIAEGKAPSHPESPFLKATYKDSQKNQGVAFRDRHSSNFVKAGETVAEIAFKKPGEKGTDVYGNDVPFVATELPQITCGNHITVKDGTHFVAEKDGIPQITDTSVAVEPAYLHKGNINLSTGNLVFDGPVVIQGNIEHGAYVSVSGDLEVAGVIEEATVKCGGNLTAAGIISGPKGIVRAQGSAKVAFISNGHIEVRGNLEVEGNITGSTILVGRNLEIEKSDSLIIGGRIEFGEIINCANLGKASGQTTEIVGGVNPFYHRKKEILTKRIAKLVHMKDEIKKGSRHLSGLKTSATSKRNASRKEDLKGALTHVSDLIERLEEKLSQLHIHLDPFEECKINVKGTLSSNCRIQLSGKTVGIPNDVTEVTVHGRRVNGSFIAPMDGSNSPTDKKTA